MSLELNHMLHCPYCGEILEISIDRSISTQEYIEDCQICCRPIRLHVAIDSRQNIIVQANTEDE